MLDTLPIEVSSMKDNLLHHLLTGSQKDFKNTQAAYRILMRAGVPLDDVIRILENAAYNRLSMNRPVAVATR
jgi:hypothetical protein